MEVFKTIPNYEEYYKVSNYGRVMRMKTYDSRGHLRNERIKKNSNAKDGYLHVGLYRDGKEIKHLLHKLVAEVFLDKKDFKYMPDEDPSQVDLEKLEVNHKDEDKTNNRVENLEWCTHKYNTNYGSMQIRRLNAWRKAKEDKKYA